MFQKYARHHRGKHNPGIVPRLRFILPLNEGPAVGSAVGFSRIIPFLPPLLVPKHKATLLQYRGLIAYTTPL